MSAQLLQDPLRPRSLDASARGGLLAVLAHALLVVALSLGVNWHIKTPEGGEAELWSEIPKAAAPAPAPAPEPPPHAGLVRFYWHHIRQVRGLAAALFVAGGASALLDMAIPACLGRLVGLVSAAPAPGVLPDGIEAQTRNVPRGRILKDEAVIDIATAAPRSVEALGRLRTIPAGFERSRTGAERS